MKSHSANTNSPPPSQALAPPPPSPALAPPPSQELAPPPPSQELVPPPPSQALVPPPPSQALASPPSQALAPPPPSQALTPPPPSQALAPPPPSQEVAPPSSPAEGMLGINIPSLTPHADGLVPWLGSHLDLPPGDSEIMPPGVLGFVFAFPDDLVVRTVARKAYIVGGFTASHSMEPLPASNDIIMIDDPMDIHFPSGGRITVWSDGFIFVRNCRPMFAPNGCEIVVPVGGLAEFHLLADHIDTSTAPL